MYFLRTLPDINELLEPLERSINEVHIPLLFKHNCSELERDILALPVRLGGLGMGNPTNEASHDYTSSVKVTAPLVERIVS